MSPSSYPSSLAAAPTSLADALRARVQALHALAERSGISAEILQGRASRPGYVLLLRNLLPAYQQLERGLELHRAAPALRHLARPEIYRADALGADLDALVGPDWRGTIPLLPAGERYARCIAAAAAGDGTRLIAHAYTRYLGDLNGGRALRRLLSVALELTPASLSFYDFPKVADLAAYRGDYRDALDRAGREAEALPPGGAAAGIIEEAAAAFAINIALSVEVLEAIRL